MRFNLSRPRNETFLISVIIALLVLLGAVVPLPIFTPYGFGLLLIAYIILLLGNLLDNL